MSDQPTERRYALTRIGPGDYLLPSNDGQTLWRIYSYEEEGNLVEYFSDGRERAIIGTFWANAKYDPYGRIDLARLPDDFLEWDRWQTWEASYRTRREAIDGALRASA